MGDIAAAIAFRITHGFVAVGFACLHKSRQRGEARMTAKGNVEDFRVVSRCKSVALKKMLLELRACMP
jgi:hypothetical protein